MEEMENWDRFPTGQEGNLRPQLFLNGAQKAPTLFSSKTARADRVPRKNVGIWKCSRNIMLILRMSPNFPIGHSRTLGLCEISLLLDGCVNVDSEGDDAFHACHSMDNSFPGPRQSNFKTPNPDGDLHSASLSRLSSFMNRLIKTISISVSL
jgi:hypothetical protein